MDRERMVNREREARGASLGYDRWLSQSRVPSAFLFALGATIAVCIPTPNAARASITLYVAFGAWVLWNGRRAFWRPFFGTLNMYQVAVMGVLVALATLLCSWIAPQSLCLAGPCVGFTPTAMDYIGAIILAPIAETIFFQGWVQTRLDAYFGGIVAVTLTTLLFATLHLELSLALVVLAVALSILRWRTGSLGAVMLAHFLYNIGAAIMR